MRVVRLDDAIHLSAHVRGLDHRHMAIPSVSLDDSLGRLRMHKRSGQLACIEMTGLSVVPPELALALRSLHGTVLRWL